MSIVCVLCPQARTTTPHGIPTPLPMGSQRHSLWDPNIDPYGIPTLIPVGSHPPFPMGSRRHSQSLSLSIRKSQPWQFISTISQPLCLEGDPLTGDPNSPPLSSTMTVWQRANNRRNSRSTGSLFLWAASRSPTLLGSNVFSPWQLRVNTNPCKRHGQAAGPEIPTVGPPYNALPQSYLAPCYAGERNYAPMAVCSHGPSPNLPK